MKPMSIEDLLEHYITQMLLRADILGNEFDRKDADLFAQLVTAQALDNLSGRMNNLYFMLKQELERHDEH